VVGSGSIENQITRQFNGFGQVTKTFQSHSGAVNPASTPSVGRSHTDGGGNVVRPTATLYPNGREVTLDYGSSGSITDKMNQVSSLIDDDSTVLAAYQHLGLGTFVQQDSTQADLRYTLISPTLSTDPDTGDIYSGLDRFGRVKDVRWRDVSAATDLSRIEYGYDRASNRTWRENPSDPNREHDWLYEYDGLDRLQSAQRGQLNGTHTAITSLDSAQCWTLDPTGNWKEFRQDKNGDGTWDFNQTRTASQVNEITDISNTPSDIWATPAYDKNGNTTTNPRPDLGTNATMTATFDAWNRMTKLVDGSSSNVLLENQFDGRNFRIVDKEYTSGTLARTREYYFTDAWQCVEEHVDTSNTPRRQYVWGLRYIDDLILRDRDISPSGGLLGERLYYLADANWNTTAVVSDSGSVQERYEYDPYGNLSIFEANFTPRAVSSYAVHYTYTSREWTPDAGLYYFRNRWYDAQLGRFSSRDPIGFVDGYSLYGQYMSLRKMDPLGFFTCCEDKCSSAGISQNPMITGYSFRGAVRGSSPGVIDSGTDAVSATDTLALIAAAGNLAASAVQGLSSAALAAAQELREQQRGQGISDAVVAAIGTLDARIGQTEGIKIWVSVSGQCCEEESCAVIMRRLDWQDHSFDYRCDVGTSGVTGAGFDPSDTAGIAAAIGGCFSSALSAFRCDKGSNADPVHE